MSWWFTNEAKTATGAPRTLTLAWKGETYTIPPGVSQAIARKGSAADFAKQAVVTFGAAGLTVAERPVTEPVEFGSPLVTSLVADPVTGRDLETGRVVDRTIDPVTGRVIDRAVLRTAVADPVIDRAAPLVGPPSFPVHVPVVPAADRPTVDALLTVLGPAFESAQDNARAIARAQARERAREVVKKAEKDKETRRAREADLKTELVRAALAGSVVELQKNLVASEARRIELAREQASLAVAAEKAVGRKVIEDAKIEDAKKKAIEDVGRKASEDVRGKAVGDARDLSALEVLAAKREKDRVEKEKADRSVSKPVK